MKRLFFLFSLLVITPLILFSQVFPGDTSTVVVEPNGFVDIVENPKLWVNHVGYLAGLVWFLAGVIIALLKLDEKLPGKKWPKLVVGMVIAVILSSLTNLLSWGLFAGDPWINTILGGIGIGAVAGSISDIGTMKVALNLILSLIRIKKEPV